MSAPAVSASDPCNEDEAFQSAVRVGLAEADSGRLTPFEPVAEWLSSWGDEDEPPPPG